MILRSNVHKHAALLIKISTIKISVKSIETQLEKLNVGTVFFPILVDNVIFNSWIKFLTI